ncbi:hypothetical protein Tco_0508434 [Tanacetum coccineum]
MGGSYYLIPYSIISTGKDRKTPHAKPDVPTTSGESLSERWTRFKDLLQKVPHHGIDLWLQVQISTSVDNTIQKDASLDYKNPDIEQLLGIMEHKGDTLIKDTISLMGKSESAFWLATNEIRKGIRQLENYMQDIIDEFMEFSSEVALRLKDRIKESESKPRKIKKIKKITKYPDTKVLENSAKHNFLENLKKKTFPTPASHLYIESSQLNTFGNNNSKSRVMTLIFRIHNGSDAKGAMSKRARRTRGHSSSAHNEIMEEKVHKFGLFNNEDHQMELQHPSPDAPILLWDNYGYGNSSLKERESREVATLSGLRNAETVNATYFTHLFEPTIGDGGYNVGNTKGKSIRNPRIKLTHRCITMTITGRKETTNRVTEINLGMFVTKIARSLGLLTNELGECCWPATRGVAREGGGDDEEGNGEGGNEEIRGFADIYHSMS